MEFQQFDRRNYPTVSARTGYGEWATTYEETVPDHLDIHVLERIKTVDWPAATQCLDLGCGTGRIGAWLRRRGVATIDGLDLTPEMIDRARAKQLYRALLLGSVEETGISGVQYDLIVMSLVDEHLSGLERVYWEAYRLSAADVGAMFVVVGMHPLFFMTGMPTHFEDSTGNPKAIETHVHLMSEHVSAALLAGWTLREMYEGVIDEDWLRVKPKWAHLRHRPVNFGCVWGRK